jgi:hypothetical protein
VSTARCGVYRVIVVVIVVQSVDIRIAGTLEPVYLEKYGLFLDDEDLGPFASQVTRICLYEMLTNQSRKKCSKRCPCGHLNTLFFFLTIQTCFCFVSFFPFLRGEKACGREK